jgi:hypothetical protein
MIVVLLIEAYVPNWGPIQGDLASRFILFLFGVAELAGYLKMLGIS